MKKLATFPEGDKAIKRHGLRASVLMMGFVAAMAATPGSATASTPLCDGLEVTIFCGGGVCNGTKGDDVMLGTSGVDIIKGGFGDDTICAGSEDDILKGGWGRDTLLGEAGNDELYGGRCDDDLDGGTVDDGGAGDICEGGHGADSITECESANQGLTSSDTASKCSGFD